jgi:SAM-dependent methyltransferase
LRKECAVGEPTPYDAYYFARGCGRPYRRDQEWLAFFDGIAARIARDIGPKSVLDAGCAFGFLVEALRERGIEAYGIDVSSYAIAQVAEGVAPFCRVASITEALDASYDLVVCIEVLEHLSPEQSEAALDRICAATDDVLFSSTPHDHDEATHVNVRPPAYWAEAFARRGFVRDVDFDASFVTDWAARFQRGSLALPRVVAAYERRLWDTAAELAARRRSDLEHRAEQAEWTRREAELAAAVLRAAALEAELEALRQAAADLYRSPGGRVLRGLQSARGRIAPEGSRRARAVARLLGQ